jgi:ABC-type bacteriocin/lantibiotic exporter with double-glycine peptidase domain
VADAGALLANEGAATPGSAAHRANADVKPCQASLDTEVVIDLSGVTYTYEGEADPVLSDVSLRVNRSEFVLILGPSGCGKSTLLHLLNGSVPHILNGTLAGTAVICGKVVADTKVADFATDVGMVFQDPTRRSSTPAFATKSASASKICAAGWTKF